MLALVRLVGIWDLLCLVSVGRRWALDDVLRQIMRVVGVVGIFVEICSLVESMSVNRAVMRAYVAVVMF
jgi:hypothetical protein